MEQFPAGKKNKTTKSRGNQMDLETIIQGEVNRTRKTNAVSFVSFTGYQL